MALSDRLKQVRSTTGDTQKNFAKSIGVSARAWQGYEDGDNVPGGNVLEALARLGFSSDWILTGEGSMRKGEGGGEGAPKGGELSDPGRYLEVPLYNVEAHGGAGTVPGHEEVIDFMAFRREWLARDLRSSVVDLVALFVSGDSMEPTLTSGDVVLIDKSRAARADDGVYVLRIGEAVKVKRVQFLAGQKLKIVSDNKAYEPETIDPKKEDVKIIGQVVWCGKRM